jgi:hypothetical protein
MIYVLAALLPPVGLLFNGQPFAAIFNAILLVLCVILGVLFLFTVPFLFFIPSVHAIVSIYMTRSQRRHREVVEAIERHGAPPGFRP